MTATDGGCWTATVRPIVSVKSENVDEKWSTCVGRHKSQRELEHDQDARSSMTTPSGEQCRHWNNNNNQSNMIASVWVCIGPQLGMDRLLRVSRQPQFHLEPNASLSYSKRPKRHSVLLEFPTVIVYLIIITFELNNF